jgi:streptogramin lyase
VFRAVVGLLSWGALARKACASAAAASAPVGAFTEFTVPTASSSPTAIAAGPDGNLWFTEASGNKIGRVTPTGMFTEFTVPTASSAPQEIAAGPDGNLWFTELNANNVGRVTPTGTFTEFRPDREQPPVRDRGGPGRESVVHRAQHARSGRWELMRRRRRCARPA